MDINAFWQAVLDQDREALPRFFHPEAVVRWHCTDEQFTVSEYVRVNCDSPGSWQGTVEQVLKTDQGFVTAVKVWPASGTGSWHAVSFITLKDGLIARLDEYWADDGEPPAWRKAMKIGRPLH